MGQPIELYRIRPRDDVHGVLRVQKCAVGNELGGPLLLLLDRVTAIMNGQRRLVRIVQEHGLHPILQSDNVRERHLSGCGEPSVNVLR